MREFDASEDQTLRQLRAHYLDVCPDAPERPSHPTRISIPDGAWDLLGSYCRVNQVSQSRAIGELVELGLSRLEMVTADA